MQKRDFWRLIIIVEGGSGLLGLALIYLLKLPAPSLRTISLIDISTGMLTAVILFIALLLLWQLDWPSIEGIKQEMANHLLPMLTDFSLSELALLAIFAGVGEELLFRGAVQIGLMQLINPISALIFAALLFGLLHNITPLYAVIATVMGLIFGILLIWQQSLWPPIIAHALYDFFALIYLVKITPPPGDDHDG